MDRPDARARRRALLATLVALLAPIALVACRARPDGPVFTPAVVEQGSAVIYVYWSQQRGGRVPVRVTIDSRPVGELRPGEHLASLVEPGEHLIRLDAGSEVVWRVVLGSGDSAYVRVATVRPGNRVRLDAPANDEARRQIAVTRAADPLPPP